MKKEQKLTALVGLILVIVLLISISFAWYEAKLIDKLAKDLASEGITINFDNSTGNKLTPDILKEGVYNGSLPNDYQERKNKNDTYYVKNFGNIIYVSEEIKLSIVDNKELSHFKESSIAFNVKVGYLSIETGEMIYLNLSEETLENYFNIDVYLSNNKLDSDNLEGLISKKLSEITIADLKTNPYLVLAISYAKPDELLPKDLVCSLKISLTITATLS